MVLVHLPAWSSSARLRLPVLMVVLVEVDHWLFSHWPCREVEVFGRGRCSRRSRTECL